MANPTVTTTATATVDELFRAAVAAAPDAIAVTDAQTRYTYAEFDDWVSRTASALVAGGIRAGSPIAVLSENRIEYLDVLMAAARLGVPVACLNWRLSPREITEALELVDPQLVLVSPRHEHVLPADGDAPRRVVLGAHWDRLVAGSEPLAQTPIVDPETALLIIYTSGSTGRAKGAAISHRAEVHRNITTRDEYSLEATDGFIAWTPLFHMGAADNALGTLMSGGTVHVVDGYDGRRIVSLLEQERLGWLLVMPGMIAEFIALLEQRGVRPRGLRVCGVMPDLIPRGETARLTTLLGAPFANTFGSTETGCPPCSAGVIPVGVTPTSLAKQQSVHCEVRLVADGVDVEPGVPGEVWMRGATLFTGYWGDADADARAFHAGWFRMGDLMVREPDGLLNFVDRSTYLIKSGGENIYPAEVERVLLAHPGVSGVAVVRRPDERWGEVPVAFVVATDDVDAAALDAWCRADLASYKRPKEFRFVGPLDLPRNVTGKVDRAALERVLQG